MADLTKDQLRQQNDTLFANNNAGNITAEDLRTFNDEMIDTIATELNPSFTGSVEVQGDVSASTYYGDGSNLSGVTSEVPQGTVSSSQQVLDYDIFATTGSNTFNGSQVIYGGITQLGGLSNITSEGLIAGFNMGYNSGGSIFTGSFSGDGSGLTNLTLPSGVVSGSSQVVLEDTTYTDNGVNSFLQTDGAGNLSFQYVKSMYEEVKNREAFEIQKGQALFVDDNTGDRVDVYLADNSNPNRFPATLIASENIPANENGLGLISGLISSIDVGTLQSGDIVYLGTNGGWTATRPTGSADIQVLGVVSRPGNNGAGYFINQLHTTLPTSAQGNVWLGDANGVPQQVSTGSFGGGGTIDTGSFATTGSNTFDGNQIISGNLEMGPDTAIVAQVLDAQEIATPLLLVDTIEPNNGTSVVVSSNLDVEKVSQPQIKIEETDSGNILRLKADLIQYEGGGDSPTSRFTVPGIWTQSPTSLDPGGSPFGATSMWLTSNPYKLNEYGYGVDLGMQKTIGLYAFHGPQFDTGSQTKTPMMYMFMSGSDEWQAGERGILTDTNWSFNDGIFVDTIEPMSSNLEIVGNTTIEGTNTSPGQTLIVKDGNSVPRLAVQNSTLSGLTGIDVILNGNTFVGGNISATGSLGIADNEFIISSGSNSVSFKPAGFEGGAGVLFDAENSNFNASGNFNIQANGIAAVDATFGINLNNDTTIDANGVVNGTNTAPGSTLTVKDGNNAPRLVVQNALLSGITGTDIIMNGNALIGGNLDFPAPGQVINIPNGTVEAGEVAAGNLLVDTIEANSGTNIQMISNTVGITSEATNQTNALQMFYDNQAVGSTFASIKLGSDNGDASLSKIDVDASNIFFGANANNNLVLFGNESTTGINFQSGDNQINLNQTTLDIDADLLVSGSGSGRWDASDIDLIAQTSITFNSNDTGQIQSFNNLGLSSVSGSVAISSDTKSLTVSSTGITTNTSISVGTVLSLQAQNPLPSGTVGDMAMSSSAELYFYDGSWRKVSLV